MSTIATSLLPASSKTSRGMSLLYSGLLKAEKVAEALHHFSYQEWIFEQQNLPTLQKMLDDKERSRWFIGVEDINWREYIHLFFYGIARWLLQEPSGSLRYALQHSLHVSVSSHACCAPVIYSKGPSGQA